MGNSWRTGDPERIKTPRKLPEKWTFLSLAFYNAPRLHTVGSLRQNLPKRLRMRWLGALRSWMKMWSIGLTAMGFVVGLVVTCACLPVAGGAYVFCCFPHLPVAN